MLRACEFMLAPGDKSVTVAGIFHHLRTQKPAMAIFDGHNDLLLNLWLHHREDPVSAFFAGIENGHLDYPRMLQGGFAGGLFALFVPPQEYIARMTPQYASQRWDPIRYPLAANGHPEATYRPLRWTLEIVSERGGYRALPRG